ncbi:MAG TPA: hypothetical protein VHS03_16560 [Gaiellaceae bacterium]|nr:hypothetical protein [Gaiellaceae bacterium]
MLEHSIGPVSLREPIHEVEHGLGKGVTIHNDQHFGHYVRYAKLGLDVAYAPGPKGEGAFAILTTSPRYRTRTGLGVGSSFAAVKSARGVRCYGIGECQHAANGPHLPGTAFSFRDGKVWRVAIAVDFD